MTGPGFEPGTLWLLSQTRYAARLIRSCYIDVIFICVDPGMSKHDAKELGCTKNAFIACANGKASDQSVHSQFLYMANLNVLYVFFCRYTAE